MMTGFGMGFSFLGVLLMVLFWGGLIALATLWWQGRLGSIFRRIWIMLLNLVLTRGLKPGPEPVPAGQDGVPYGAAMAVGMLALVVFGY